MIKPSEGLRRFVVKLITFLTGIAILLLLGVPSMSSDRNSGQKYSDQSTGNAETHGRDIQRLPGGLLQMRSTAP